MGAFGDSRTLVPLLIVVGILGLSLLLAFSLTQTSAFLVLGGMLGVILLGASFLSPPFGVAILVMSMLLSPQFGAGGLGGAGVETGRAVVIRLDDVLNVILSLAWFARTAVHKDLGLIRQNPLNRPIAFYVVSCIISTVIGFMAGNVKGLVGGFFVIRYIEYFVIFFLAINFINSVAIMRRFMNLAIFTSVLVALYGMYQIPLGIRVSAPFEGPQGEPNTMGGYLLLLMCMAGGQLLFARGLRPILGWSAYLFMLFVPLLFTGSRASWLGIPASLAAFFILSHRKKEIAIATLLLAVSGAFILPQSVKERILFTFQQREQFQAKQVQIGGLRLDTSTSARLESYQVSLDGFRQKPILGWGVTGFVFIDSQYVRTLAETGLVGMVAFLWLTWGYFQCGRAAMRAAPDRFQRGIAIGYLAGLAGLLMHAVGTNTFIILRIMEPWMLFTAMVVRIPGIYEERQKRWEEMEAAGEVPAPAEPSPPEAPPEGEIPPSEEKFEKKLSEYERFLERERIEMERRAIEAQRKEVDLPEFRKRMAAESAKPPAPGGNGAASAPQSQAFRKVPRNVDLIRQSPSKPFERRRS